VPPLRRDILVRGIAPLKEAPTSSTAAALKSVATFIVDSFKSNFNTSYLDSFYLKQNFCIEKSWIMTSTFFCMHTTSQAGMGCIYLASCD
jgi:hypothetical protein